MLVDIKFLLLFVHSREISLPVTEIGVISGAWTDQQKFWKKKSRDLVRFDGASQLPQFLSSLVPGLATQNGPIVVKCNDARASIRLPAHSLISHHHLPISYLSIKDHKQFLEIYSCCLDLT
jgi:hypothetical protein